MQGGSPGSGAWEQAKHTVRRSELDSRRFGLEVYRTTLQGAAELERLLTLDAECGAELLMVRVPTTRLEWVQRLERAGAFLCDTLAYWGCSQMEFRPSGRKVKGSSIRVATTDDVSIVRSLSLASFAGFSGHYHADPRLDSQAATEGYAAWAASLVESSESLVFLASVDDVPLGFLAATLDAEQQGEIVLNGVAPAGRGQGLYAALVDEAASQLFRRGATRITSSTQVGNLVPQRVWSRCGLTLEQAVHTLHLWYPAG